jgi:hypothetical protein
LKSIARYESSYLGHEVIACCTKFGIFILLPASQLPRLWTRGNPYRKPRYYLHRTTFPEHSTSTPKFCASISLCAKTTVKGLTAAIPDGRQSGASPWALDTVLTEADLRGPRILVEVLRVKRLEKRRKLLCVKRNASQTEEVRIPLIKITT